MHYIGKYRHYIGNRHYSAHSHYWLFPECAKRFHRHCSGQSALYRDICCSMVYLVMAGTRYWYVIPVRENVVCDEVVERIILDFTAVMYSFLFVMKTIDGECIKLLHPSPPLRPAPPPASPSHTSSSPAHTTLTPEHPATRHVPIASTPRRSAFQNALKELSRLATRKTRKWPRRPTR